ncbi:MAG: sodium-dependent transporter [Prevotella sp.]|nr:sodium-dependent transporter [Prevotella sp.]
MTQSDRGSFGTKIGVILATAGSAVGLGNIWRFPFMTGQNGGAAFIVIYIGCIMLLGLPGMISEFVVGRNSRTNAARAYMNLSGRRRWGAIGYMGIVTSTIILGFYAVVAGWCLQYLWASLSGELGGDAGYVSRYFADFSSHPVKPVLWGLAFILMTHLVIVRGVRSGIERVSKMLMPTLFVLLLILVVASCMLPGAGRGIEFLFRPDFSRVDSNVFLEALGQAFFSLSLGTACLCTYASYFGRRTNLMRSAFQIAAVDTLVAILAGLMIFPAAFSVGISPDSGLSLIFITLPNVFREAFSAMPVVGYVISVLFYVLLALAALTSTISMHEIGTAFFHEECHLPRRRAAWIVTGVTGAICVICSLSVGALPSLRVAGMSFMDACDALTAQLLMPVGAFLTCLYVGWFAPHKTVRQELTNDGTLRNRFFHTYLFVVKYVCPVCITMIFLHQLGII